MNPVILFRGSLAEEGELACAKKYFDVVESRMDIKKDQLVIGRYSVLPYYRELEIDILKLGGHLVNSSWQHQHVADIQNWYPDFEEITPKTWMRLEDVPQDYAGSVILKGHVNSRKQLWKTMMFARTRKEMLDVYFRLMDDSLLSHQGVCIREFVDFIKFGINDITGCPISKEYRIIVYNQKPIAQGYYWSNYAEYVGTDILSEDLPKDFIQDAINRVGFNSNFWILDIGQLVDGRWIVVELGDAQMAGLSCIDPDTFYKNLREAIGG
jgi:hypothetical protein